MPEAPLCAVCRICVQWWEEEDEVNCGAHSGLFSGSGGCGRVWTASSSETLLHTLVCVCVRVPVPAGTEAVELIRSH